jgi:hypothetical protein
VRACPGGTAEPPGRALKTTLSHRWVLKPTSEPSKIGTSRCLRVCLWRTKGIDANCRLIKLNLKPVTKLN